MKVIQSNAILITFANKNWLSLYYTYAEVGRSVFTKMTILSVGINLGIFYLNLFYAML